MQRSWNPLKTLVAMLAAFLVWQDNGLALDARPTVPAPSDKPNNELVAVSAPRPEYPYEARKRRITGSGIAAITIDVATGDVTNAGMLRSIGDPILDNAALSAFRRWRFKPGISTSKAWIDITFTVTGASYHLLSAEPKSTRGELAQPNLTTAPSRLTEAFAILNRAYPSSNPRWFVRPPADVAWIFSAFNGSVGTVEVGFQQGEVVYMIFRRGVGGLGWKRPDIDALHNLYCKDLLRERKCGETYISMVAPQISAAIIVRKDFDTKALLSGL